MSFKNIGEKIKALREQSGYSQGALAKRAKIAQSTLSYIEKGVKSPTMDTVVSICEGLSISVLDLMMAGEPEGTDTKVKNKRPRKRSNLEDALNQEFKDFKDYIIEKYGK